MTRSAAHLLLVLSPLWVLALRQALATIAPVCPGPDALLAAAAVAALRAPPGRAALFAAVAGCLADVTGDAPFGLLGARLAALVAIFGGLRRGLEAGTITQAVLVLAFALVERALGVLLIFATHDDIALAPLLARAGTTALWTTALTPLAFAAGRALLPDDER
jgi:hypothetical protein